MLQTGYKYASTPLSQLQSDSSKSRLPRLLRLLCSRLEHPPLPTLMWQRNTMIFSLCHYVNKLEKHWSSIPLSSKFANISCLRRLFFTLFSIKFHFFMLIFFCKSRSWGQFRVTSTFFSPITKKEWIVDHHWDREWPH